MGKKTYNHDECEKVLEDLFLKRFELDMRKNNGEFKEKALLGNIVGLNARDLIYIYYDIESKFDIEIPQEQVAKGNFDTFNHILEIVREQLNENCDY